VSEGEPAGARIRALVDRAFDAVPPIWPIGGFIATNPLGGFEGRPMREAIAHYGRATGAAGFLSAAHYRELFERGDIAPAALERVLDFAAGDAAAIVAERFLTAREVLRAYMTYDGDPAALAAAAAARTAQRAPGQRSGLRLLARVADEAFGSNVSARVDERTIAWCSAFTDEGQAAWPMPERETGFYRAWRRLARYDSSATARSIPGYRDRIAAVPERPEETIAAVLSAFEIERDAWGEYIALHALALPGWSGLARWQALYAREDARRAAPFDPAGVIAVRLWYEAALAEAAAAQHGVRATLAELTARAGAIPRERLRHEANELARTAAALGLDVHEVEALTDREVEWLLQTIDPDGAGCGELWLRAHELTVRDGLLGALAAPPAPQPEQPAADLVFCIDARSEGLRRALEATGPYRTRGFAGFFGLPIAFRSLDSAFAQQACPVLLAPKHTIAERPAGESDPAAGGRVFLADLSRILAEIKGGLASPFVLFEAAGVFFAPALAGRTFFARGLAALRGAIARAVAPPVPTGFVIDKHESDPALGFTPAEQIFFAEASLALMDLRDGFAPLEVFVGHGSSTENNPFEASLDCGACAGYRGGPNARILAQLLNDGRVRAGLRERGIDIPATTWFAGAEHDTATDRVVIAGVASAPPSHAAALAALERDLRTAGERLATERAKSLPLAAGSDAAVHVAERSVDWAQVRPEWGLARNAAFIIAPRALTYGRSLERRAFLHEYDAGADEDGALLEIIMTAPLVVAQWINNHYYFASVDNERFGSGNKVIHNVVGRAGVMLGNRSDLKSGLPWQSLASGEGLYHDPVRLLAIVAAPRARIDAVIARNTILQRLFHNEWIALAAWEEDRAYVYRPDQAWEPYASLAPGREAARA
jgi:hypothetical protein